MTPVKPLILLKKSEIFAFHLVSRPTTKSASAPVRRTDPLPQRRQAREPVAPVGLRRLAGAERFAGPRRHCRSRRGRWCRAAGGLPCGHERPVRAHHRRLRERTKHCSKRCRADTMLGASIQGSSRSIKFTLKVRNAIGSRSIANKPWAPDSDRPSDSPPHPANRSMKRIMSFFLALADQTAGRLRGRARIECTGAKCQG